MFRECVGDSGGAGEIMLFGVRVVVDAMRKSVSMNNLSQYEQPQEEGSKVQNTVSVNNNNTREDVAAAASGYASADDAVPNSRSSRDRERKRGVPWTEEEHKLFLLGLQKVGKGDWRGISRNFVKTRTPTQVASHAQKYFLRRSNLNRRRRRTSLFDITTDTMQKLTRPEENSGQSGLFQAEVTATPMEAQGHHQDAASHSHPSFPPPAPTESCNFSGFPMMGAFPMTVGPAVVPIENPTLRQGNVEINAASSLKLVRPIPIHTASHASTISEHGSNSKSAVDPSSLTLMLSLPSDQRESPSRHSAFQAMPSFDNGDSIITVA